MKILMTTDTVGGVWTYAVQLAAALEPHGVEVALATLGGLLSADQQAEASRLPNVRLYSSGYKLEWMQDPWEDVRAAGLWLLRIAQEFGPDVVHLNDYSQGVLSWPAPVLMVGHSCVLSWFEAVRGCPAGPEWNTYRHHVRAGLQAADLVVAPTRTMLECLDRHYGPLRHRRVIFNGCDAPAVQSHAKELRVLAAGRLWDEAKNITTLAAAAAEIRCPVYVAGDAQHPDGGRASFPTVHLLGRLDRRRMRQWFAHAAIYALPARYEPFGLTPLEAALAGCALVLGEIPSLHEIWGDAACFVPPDDAVELAATVNRLIDDYKLRIEYEARAFAHAATLTAERMAGDYLAAYRDLLDSQPHRHMVSATGDI